MIRAQGDNIGNAGRSAIDASVIDECLTISTLFQSRKSEGFQVNFLNFRGHLQYKMLFLRKFLVLFWTLNFFTLLRKNKRVFSVRG